MYVRMIKRGKGECIRVPRGMGGGGSTSARRVVCLGVGYDVRQRERRCFLVFLLFVSGTLF